MCIPSGPKDNSHPQAPYGIPRIGDKVPDFTTVTTHGELKFSEWQEGKWVVLFSHPADFTPVCSTEVSGFAIREEEFTKRNTKLIGLSIDSIHSHLAWRENLQNLFDCKINFPIIADHSAQVALKFGMIHPGESSSVTVRAVFVIDPNQIIRALIYYPLNVGRNMDEIIRLIDALQTADQNSVACPLDWKPGEKVIVPPPKTDKDVENRKGSDYEKIDFYLCKKELK